MNAVLRFGLMRRQFKKLDQFLKTRTTKLVNSSMNDPQLFGGIILDTAACKIGKQNIYALTRASIKINPGEIRVISNCLKSFSKASFQSAFFVFHENGQYEQSNRVLLDMFEGIVDIEKNHQFS